ncbi:hypothetical protein BDZ45DRAFT_714474 [Acephala macrosclerotiorum]|nr:hypothetical protein BDZ45DRAFT_714474 [Acephala macrosclerotiorum]
MLRKIGRRLSPHNSDVLQSDRAIDSNDTSLAVDIDDDDDTSKDDWRSSEPARHLSPSYSLFTPLADARRTRHASISTEIPLSNRLHQQTQGTILPEILPPLLDNVGLSLVYTCGDPIVDLIFVHGLGGASIRTWSWKRDPQKFWPSWLGQEADVCNSRIFTFGYEADIFGDNTPLNILDFAKALLFQMKTYSNAQSVNNQPIGTYPLIFVMHSMGGLVVKKAYIIGKHDDQYAPIISQIHAMLFLATPHRGSSYADYMNNVLSTTPGFAAKIYVSELEKASTSLQDINEQFRTVCDDIKLVSLYENQKTNIGLGIKKMIVDRESAVLGYPTEISTYLGADHHGMCKFSDTNDPNYKQVRDLLRLFVSPFKLLVVSQSKGWAVSHATKTKLEELLGIQEDPADDFEITRDRIMEGSCQWILRRKTYSDWKDTMSGNSKILWLTGLPAAGKSILSSFVIDSLQKDSSIENCCYHFFKSEHQTKRTIGQMLRSVAYQVAISSQLFREKLLELYDSGTLPFGRQKVNTIWEAIFDGILFRQRFDEPIYWILDGLDEADCPEVLVRLLSKMQSSNRFRILIVSRPMRDLATSFGSNTQVVHDEISLEDTCDDIKAYTTSVISATLHSGKFQDDICTKVLEKAHGSFLWVSLALDQLKNNWHTENDVGQVLNDLPGGMEPLYVRMMNTISKQAPRPRAIALKILTWTVCVFRPLELAELEVALESEFGNFLCLKDTVSQICGNFIIVEKSRVALIHDTARHFLLHKTSGLPLTIDHRLGNEQIASTCLKYLTDPKKNWRHIFALAQMNYPPSESQKRSQHVTLHGTYPFLSYAVTWWTYHVSLAPPHTGLVSQVLEFLEHSCLVWINAIALLGDMGALTRAAQYIKLYVKRKNRKSSIDSLMSVTGNRDDELKQWAKDLIRVVGRFGNILTQSPMSVYQYTVPFCPRGSIISRTYPQMSGLSIVGISSDAWDDCLARLTIGNDEYASQVLCKGMYFVTLIERGVLVVWHAESCAEARRIDHGEWISVMECSRVSSIVVTAGMKTIRAWDITTGDEIFCMPKLYSRRILALSLGITDDELFIGYDDASIQCVDLTSYTEKWKILLKEPGDSEHLCPHLISFSPDNSLVLIGYRGRPMLVWSLDSPTRGPQKCIRPEDRYGRHHNTWKAGTPECVVWRPDLLVVLIIYNDNALFEWNIEDDTQREISEIGAREMALSPDGNLLLTSDYTGTLRVWTVPEFRLTYQLQEDDMVRSLAFSPDGQRFYDIRGPLCNVWEPDALIRPDDLDREELSSTQDTTFSEAISSANEAGRAQITALICDTEDRFYCCGKDGGAVVLHNIRTGKKIRKVYGHAAISSIIEMAWSTSGKYIASADDCGWVIAKRLRKPTTQLNSWAVYPLLDFRPGEAISQLLFGSSEEYLLVSSSTRDWVWSLQHKKEVCVSEHPTMAGKWVNHPLIADQLICIESGEVRLFSWGTLKEIRRTALNGIEESTEDDNSQNIPGLNRLSLQRTTSENPLSIERAIQVHSTQIIFEVSPNMGSKGTDISRRTVMLLDIPSLRKEPIIICQSGQANRLIGSFHGHVVFLDHQYCFCTWDLRNGATSLKRHFFLPKDWLSPGMLNLCIVNSHGTILCPKNGEVAIIRAGIKF